MATRASYKTKQKETLIRFLESVPGRSVTAADVCTYLKEQGEAVGLTTVYRRLEQLVNEGIVTKYIPKGNGPARFEYVGGSKSAEEELCFYCKCEYCGKLIPLDCDDAQELQSHVYRHHRFRLNPSRTVFYGICDACKNEERK